VRTAFRSPLVVGLVVAIFGLAIYTAISLIAGAFTPYWAAFSAVAAFLIGVTLTYLFARRS
jgi:hypothetical protein